ncbi:MAG: hypothetical protein M0P31_13785 [Solirubrobacteraceae bacterium]|nr:hypothetical protein [Solirubrobacteraceae bacterium]
MIDLGKPRAARIVLEYPGGARDSGKDERFIEAVRGTFPHQLQRQLLPTDAPPNLVHLALASTASQVSVSATAVELNVQFFGDFRAGQVKALAYLREKAQALFAGASSTYGTPVSIGIVKNISFETRLDDESSATALLADHHVRYGVPAHMVQEGGTRVALKVPPRHFVTLGAEVYEIRNMDRPLIPGVPVTLYPWQANVAERGIEVSVDVNSRYASYLARDLVVADGETLESTFRLLEFIASDVAPQFAGQGTIDYKRVAEEACRYE